MKLNEAVNTTSETNVGEKSRDIRTAELLFSAGNVGATVVACAMIGPKIPPFSGD